MKRTCPRDGTPLREERAGRVNIDVCAECRGAFVDGIELRRVVGDDELALALGGRQGTSPTPLACAACASTMYLDLVDTIELDHCGFCLGVWLDAGELERLASRAMIAHARAPKLDTLLREVAGDTRSGSA